MRLLDAGNLVKEPACQRWNSCARLRRTEACIGGKTVNVFWMDQRRLGLFADFHRHPVGQLRVKNGRDEIVERRKTY